MSFFDDKENYVGSLLARLETEAGLVKGGTGVRLSATFQAVSGLVMSLFIGFYYGWQLTLLMLLAIPVMVALGGINVKFQAGFQMSAEAETCSGGKVRCFLSLHLF